ncbi:MULTISPECIES: dTMP kinase [Gordonia]|uniref:dTMP kinase n=1 Tax=Gordonia TaxID=2053 RepID=UPI00068A5D1C|nr:MULTISPECIES: dTMP kinase [Gordonia]NKY91837.1 dTMP kinase [Gordonia sputi]OBB98955.1 thymidylate kinase [Gordonia sp. 852002-50395_SCH5434458]
MGVLIAVEGLDGAGKNTLVTGVVDELTRRGAAVSTFTFPRYGSSVFADVASEALHGEHGDLRESVNAMALLFALDRADAAAQIRAALTESDVVILDRYVASNAAYSAGRLRQDASGDIVRWVADLEFGRFDVPVPDQHLLLGVPATVAMERARSRAATDPSRPRDAYERDDDLQMRVDSVYRQLAAESWASPWIEVGTDSPESVEPAGLVARLMHE